MASIKEVCWMKLACKLGLPMTMRKPLQVIAGEDGGTEVACTGDVSGIDSGSTGGSTGGGGTSGGGGTDG